MNVLNVITGNDNGGGGEYVLNICKSSLYNSKLLCIGKGPLYDKAKELNLDVICMELNQILGSGLTNYINLNNIEIILWHGAKAFFLHYLIKRKINTKSIATVHSNYKNDFDNNTFKSIVFTKLSFIGLKSFNNYLAVSNSISKQINKDFKPKKIFIIKNAIDLSKIKPNNKLSKENLNISDNDFVFINIARLHPVKNHINLLKGFKKFSTIYSNSKIILIGDGDEYKNIVKFIQDNNMESRVVMLGQKADAYKYLEVCDANILASINEGGEPPIVILEGAAMEKPNLCSDIEGMKEIVLDKYGYRFDPYDYESIANAMIKCLKDNKKNEKVSNFKEFVKDNHSISSFHYEFYEMYNNVINLGENDI